MKHAGTFISRWKCGCICELIAGYLIVGDDSQRQSFYAVAAKHRLEVYQMTESDQWPPQWECSSPVDQCLRQIAEANS